jgi:hypothetical protein
MIGRPIDYELLCPSLAGWVRLELRYEHMGIRRATNMVRCRGLCYERMQDALDGGCLMTDLVSEYPAY